MIADTHRTQLVTRTSRGFSHRSDGAGRLVPENYFLTPSGENPIPFLFGEKEVFFPKSRLTPEILVELYRRMAELCAVSTLVSKNEDISYGLESLQSMLRRTPRHSFDRIRVDAPNEMISAALPPKTPYQLQYLALFPLEFPSHLFDLPTFPNSNDQSEVAADVNRCGLLLGKNSLLYKVTARWSPAEQWDLSKRETEKVIYTYNLAELDVQQIAWDGPELLEKVTNGEWGKYSVVQSNIQYALSATCQVLRSRAEYAAEVEKQLGMLPIHPYL